MNRHAAGGTMAGAGARPDWIGRIVAALVVVAVAVVLGTQYIDPNKRVLATLAGLTVFGIAWRLDMVSGLGLLVLTLPYPRGTVFGSTNVAFILLLLVIWLLRVSQGHAPAPRRTVLDVGIVGLIVAYIVSFYNLKNAVYVNFALQNLQLFLACVMLFYLVVNSVRTERDLKRVHAFQVFSIFTVCLIGLYELNHPGGALVPGWITFSNTLGNEFNTHNVRIGGPFFDYELFCEYCALSLLFVGFMWTRSRTAVRRVFFVGLGLLVLFMMFATITRGGFLALAAGILYLMWIQRRRLRLIPIVVGASLLGVVVYGMDWFVTNYTRSGNVMARFGQTKFEGVVPVARAEVWTEAWNRMLEHPIIGHGPYYPTQEGVHMLYWPHNVYLYFGNLVGFVGLAFFLLILWKLWTASRSSGREAAPGSYTRAFLVLANVQLLVFMVDQIKIDYLRNWIYQFQVWFMFAMLVAGSRIARRTAAAGGSST